MVETISPRVRFAFLVVMVFNLISSSLSWILSFKSNLTKLHNSKYKRLRLPFQTRQKLTCEFKFPSINTKDSNTVDSEIHNLEDINSIEDYVKVVIENGMLFSSTISKDETSVHESGRDASLSCFDILKVSGKDQATFLHNQLTNSYQRFIPTEDVQARESNVKKEKEDFSFKNQVFESSYTNTDGRISDLLISVHLNLDDPKGKKESEGLEKENILLLASFSRGDFLNSSFNKYIFPLDQVKVEDISSSMSSLIFFGNKRKTLDFFQWITNSIDNIDLGFGSFMKEDKNENVIKMKPSINVNVEQLGDILFHGKDGIILSGTPLRLPGCILLLKNQNIAKQLAELMNQYKIAAFTNKKADKSSLPSSSSSIPKFLIGDSCSYNILRILQGKPKEGSELVRSITPLEAGLWHTVHFDKGCYLGQETLAKVGNNQGERQRLYGFNIKPTSFAESLASQYGIDLGSILERIISKQNCNSDKQNANASTEKTAKKKTKLKRNEEELKGIKFTITEKKGYQLPQSERKVGRGGIVTSILTVPSKEKKRKGLNGNERYLTRKKEYSALGYLKKNAGQSGDKICLNLELDFLKESIEEELNISSDKTFKVLNEEDIQKIEFHGTITDIPYPTRTMGESASPSIHPITEISEESNKIQQKRENIANTKGEDIKDQQIQKKSESTTSLEEAKAVEAARKAAKLAEMKKKLEAFQAKKKKTDGE